MVPQRGSSRNRCSEQIRRKAVTQSYGATAGHTRHRPPSRQRSSLAAFSCTAAPATHRSPHCFGGFMRTTFFLAVALAVATAALQAQTGNGAPSGSHYNLNIIGVSHDKNPSMDQGSGNVIFVDLGSKDVTVSTKILLSQSADAGTFQVLDKNGTDGRSEEHTSELQSQSNLVCRLLLEKKKQKKFY